MDESLKEREILAVMRKVLGRVVRDTTPPPGMKHPLSEATIEEIRLCFGLISARERELSELAGDSPMRPGFIDEPKQHSEVISIDSLKKK